METTVNSNIINPNLKLNLINEPYPVWIIDNFLDPAVIDNMLSSWVPITDDRWHNEYGYVDGETNLLERGMKSLSNFDLMPEYIREVMNYFHTTEFINFVSNLTTISDLSPDTSKRWSGMRNMLPDSFQLIHSDARKNPETGLRKELTCLLYLNKDYNRERDEGCLEIWKDDMTEKAYEVEPIANRLVIFLNSEKSYHGVPLVKSERKALTFSILANRAATDVRAKALFVARPFDSDAVKEQGIKRSQM